MKTLLLSFSCLFVYLFAGAQLPSYQWAKTVSGTNFVVANAVTLDGSGNTITVGNFKGIADFDNGPATYTLDAALGEGFITKSDAAGNLIWARQVGEIATVCTAVDADQSNAIYVTGYFEGIADFNPSAAVTSFTTNGSSDVFILKLNNSGNLIWARQIGSSSGDRALSIVADAAGNVYTGGFFCFTADFDPGPGQVILTSHSIMYDMFISKLDASGNFAWAQSMGNNDLDCIRAMCVDGIGNIYATGFFGGTFDFDNGPGTVTLTGAGSNPFVLKLDPAGSLQWARSFYGAGDHIPYDIAVDAGGNVYTTGDFSGVVDFDPGAGTLLAYSTGTTDIYVSKLDAGGNFGWIKTIANGVWFSGGSISLDGGGGVYVSGQFTGTTDLEPGPGTILATAQGNEELFMVKLDAAGICQWVHAFGGPGSERLKGTVVDFGGNIYSVGSISSSVDFDPGAGQSVITVTNTSGFIQKLAQNFVGIKENANALSFFMYPNPANNILELEFTGYGTANVPFNVSVCDPLGKLVLQGDVINGVSQLNVSNLNKGFYFITVTNGSILLASEKFIKD